MNKEYIRLKLVALYNFFKAVGIKARYRITIISKFAIDFLKRNTFNLGRMLAVFVLANKKRIALGAATACVFVVCAVAAINGMTGYEYSYNGETLGVVEKAECVYDGIKKAEQALTQKVGAQVVIDEEEDIQLKRVIKDADKVSEEEDVVNALTSIENIKVIAYAVNITKTVDAKAGETTSHSIYLDTRENADAVLNSVKGKYTEDIDPKELVGASFEENVTITESKVFLEDIVDTSSAIKAIMNGGVKEKIHVVELGDSLASIADKYNVSRKNLKKWNWFIEDDNVVYVGQKIHLEKQVPLLNVITKKNVTITEDFDAKTDYTDTDKLYKGQEIVTKEGKSGNRTVNADIIEKNGKQTDRIDLNFVINKEPIATEAMRGTKKRPDKIGKGYYYNPMNGSHTSSFGSRWGRIHEGMDIAGPVGSSVFAADAGVVTEAGGTSNGYGIAVRIDHGKGRTTYYAHNSKVLVKVGDIVYRGQQIAESGNTGSSTGPHLHFETRFNGVPKNPGKYL